jgi:hypothetical protein
MPRVEPTEVTSEESQQQLDAQESMESNLLDKIKGGDVVKSLDLPDDAKPDVQGGNQEEDQPDDTSSEEEQFDGQEGEQDDLDEEVVPKSKIQPRIDRLTSQIKMLEQRLAEKEEASTPGDDTQRRLDAMSENDLEDTLTQVRLAKEKSRDDDAKLLELVRLERQIEKTIVQAPQKFVQKQVKEFNNAAGRLQSEGDITEANSAKVMEIAKDIYGRYPKLSKQVDGQAMALELAVAHYKELNKTTTVRTQSKNLKGQLNTLKKRTLLDTKTRQAGGDKVNLDRLRNNAMTGTMKDKEKFAHNDPRFKIDAMIPDHLKG